MADTLCCVSCTRVFVRGCECVRMRGGLSRPSFGWKETIEHIMLYLGVDELEVAKGEVQQTIDLERDSPAFSRKTARSVRRSAPAAR